MSDLISFLGYAEKTYQEKSGAEFSGNRKYRYALWRIWDSSLPLVMFIGLNPSTATEVEDDPTIRRVKSMAKNFGYGGVFMMNLFAIISPDPKILQTTSDPVGENDFYLNKISKECKDIIFAWGNFREAEERAKEIIELFPNALVLGTNKNGSPKHPLYVPAKVSLKKFRT